MTTESLSSNSRAPEFRHASEIPLSLPEQMLTPLRWKVGHWALFGAMLTLIADIIALLYIFNFFGIERQFEIEMWILIAGILGFASITASLYAIFFKSGRGTGIVALIASFIIGGAPAWLFGNTIIQLIINGGTLPDAPINW
ncbi:hypothetical protein [Gulosibacter molinativorax]|uniref:ABC transporter permease n=1 Tax=Gulosibacter molinativorax TaxID=256821 RepID=A0ABT7CB18_9MICO|nr:hypothetical protein [Gulosibacter molinativorax]MDJ1372315.1 hypothetical protein [Gulosibacter molinativorax]QUY63409.1 Hypotetical protein [Gulosibacter molinativorax]